MMQAARNESIDSPFKRQIEKMRSKRHSGTANVEMDPARLGTVPTILKNEPMTNFEDIMPKTQQRKRGVPTPNTELVSFATKARMTNTTAGSKESHPTSIKKSMYDSRAFSIEPPSHAATALPQIRGQLRNNPIKTESNRFTINTRTKKSRDVKATGIEYLQKSSELISGTTSIKGSTDASKFENLSSSLQLRKKRQ